MDALAEDCQREVEAATDRVKRDLAASVLECNAILEPLEPPALPPKAEGEAEEEEDEAKLLDELEDLPMDGTIDPAKAKAVAAENAARKALRVLGERTEGEVRGILAALEAATQLRRQRIQAFSGPSGELARIDDLRKSSAEELLKKLVEALTAAAHVVHGEAERLVEERALSFNEILLENRKSMQQLSAKLTVQTLENSKEYKVRWHKGLLLWKQQRHRHSMAVVMRRIKSNEFRQPESLVEAVGKVREHQSYVFRQRKDLIDELFAIPQHRLIVAAVRHIEEQNTQLNDRAQETFDTLLVELRELREALNVSAEQMLGELGLELELHDARQEWRGHDSVANLIDAEVRPPLRECLDQVASLLHALSNKLTQQEEALHHSVTSVITFFLGLARKQELLKKRVEEFEVNYNGEVEDCEKDFEETCERNENKMQDLHAAIDDAAHHETLDELKQKTFDHLDQMAVGYRDHADQMLQIHNRYPGEAQDLIRRETRGYCKDLGLALDPAEEAPALAAERKAAAAALEEEAIAKAKDAHPAAADEDEAARSGRLELLAAAVEAAKAEVQQAAEAKEAAALEAEAQLFAGLEEKSEWTPGEGTGCRVLENLGLEDLRGQILQPPEPEPTEPDAGAAGGASGEPVEGESMDTEPKFADGTDALDTLAFDNSWFEENLSSLRSAIFENLAGQKRYLDRVDIPAACEEVRRDLDQRLRRHTNRKGEVQVEWYVPRYSTVSKHKDKFERHLVQVAQKCQDQDDAVEATFEEIDVAEEQFKQRVAHIQENLGDAETLPVLTSMERQAGDCMSSFKELCRSAVRKLLELSSKAPQGLQKENQAFLMMCKKGEEQYSEPEIMYYGGEAPMDAFAAAYATAVETLCASKGFGRKYGEPRRRAQERVRVCAMAELGSHLGAFRASKYELAAWFPASNRERSEASPEQRREADRALQLSQSLEESCFLQSNATDILQILAVCEASQALRDDSLLRVLGPLLKSERFNNEIQSVIKASNEAYAGQAGGTPDFMQKFLSDMQVSCEHARQEASRSLRTWGDELREETLLCLGDKLFSELTQRALSELAKTTRDAHERTVQTWKDFGKKRANHEQRLNPRLADANKEVELQELVEAEAKRHADALTTCKEDRERMATALRDACASFVGRLTNLAEVAMRLVDLLPLHSHFGALPGDEKVEPPRMSIKRRLRRLNAEEEKPPEPVPKAAAKGKAEPKAAAAPEEPKPGLPERQWQGLPKNELRALLCSGGWPTDPVLTDEDENLDEQKVQELTEPMKSFRSPVHRSIINGRLQYYEHYKKQFAAEVFRWNAEMSAREAKEQAGEKNWQSMIRQLRGE
ncbi:Zc3h6 [Symbiodinium pilosum]|uniref:Zc3h6 protein n=1 Tax=Symbiodinium pilosum TaxID=2952 RepID=A0A812SKG7_SYMPI|nr:Zc3h6 [Symbiodinium pilosum]